MRDSKLIKLFSTFQRQDWKVFNQYLLLNKGPQTEEYILYDYIQRFKENLSHDNLEAQKVISSLFSSKNRKNFFNLMSRLHKQTLEFIGELTMKQDHRLKHLYIAKALNDRGLFDQVIKYRDQYVNSSEKWPIDIWNSYYRLRLDHELKFSNNPLKDRLPKKAHERVVKQWAQLYTELSTYYLTDAINEGLIRQGQDNGDHFIELLRSAQNTYKPNSEVSQLLNTLASLLEHNSTKAFDQLYDSLLCPKIHLSDNIGALILLHLIQYLHRKMELGQIDMTKLLSLYEHGLSTGWLMTNNRIASTRFIAMIQFYCYMYKTDEAMSILKEYGPKVTDSKKKDSIYISKALILFHMNKHGKSLEILNTTSFSKGKLKNLSRVLLFMNFISLYTDKSFLFGQIDNLDAYMKRAQHIQPEASFDAYLNFSKVMRKIIKSGPSGICTVQLTNVKPLLFRPWLVGYVENHS